MIYKVTIDIFICLFIAVYDSTSKLGHIRSSFHILADPVRPVRGIVFPQMGNRIEHQSPL